MKQLRNPLLCVAALCLFLAGKGYSQCVSPTMLTSGVAVTKPEGSRVTGIQSSNGRITFQIANSRACSPARYTISLSKNAPEMFSIAGALIRRSFETGQSISFQSAGPVLQGNVYEIEAMNITIKAKN